MRTLLGLLWRGLLFAVLVHGAMIWWTPIVGAAEPADQAKVFFGVVRWSLFWAASMSLLLEWIRLHIWLKNARRILRRPPSRLRPAWALRWPILLVGWMGWLVLLQVRALWAFGTLSCLAPIGAVLWTLMTALVLTMLSGAVGRARLGWALHRKDRRKLGVTMPGVLGVCGMLVMAACFVRLPHASVVDVTGRLALAMLEPMIPDPEDNWNLPSDRRQTYRPAAQGPKAVASQELLVRLGPDDHISEIQQTIRDFHSTSQPAASHASVFEDPRSARTYVVSGRPVSIMALWFVLSTDDENVEHIELNEAVHLTPAVPGGACPTQLFRRTTNDPLAGGQSELNVTGVASILGQYGRPSRRTTLAVIDTGVDGRHEDLREALAVGEHARDHHGHGTAVAGAAAAVANNFAGMASANDRGRWIAVRSYPALDAQRPRADDVADAIYQAEDDGAQVIVMSFGARGTAPALVRDAIAYARSRGIIVVAAAGNNDGASYARQWPANVDGVVVVGATSSGRRASYSNSTRGATFALSAPGTEICSPVPGGGYERRTGTSLATPQVAGILAAYRAMCPSSPADAVVRRAMQTADASVGGAGPQIRADRLFQGGCVR